MSDDEDRVGTDLNLLSEYAVAILDIGVAIRLTSLQKPGIPGPQLKLVMYPEQVEELAECLLDSVSEWKKKHAH